MTWDCSFTIKAAEAVESFGRQRLRYVQTIRVPSSFVRSQQIVVAFTDILNKLDIQLLGKGV
jgi:hypothetical protein